MKYEEQRDQDAASGADEEAREQHGAVPPSSTVTTGCGCMGSGGWCYPCAVKLDNERGELRIVLGSLLNLFDPPGEVKRRHHAEDENGFWMAVSGTVQIGRQLIPRPEACRMCRGGGADEYGAECSDCDGEGYDAKTPLTDAEKRVWQAISRNVAERAKEE